MMEFACLCGNIFKKIVSDVARTFFQLNIFLEILYRIAEDIYRLDNLNNADTHNSTENMNVEKL